MELVRLYSRFGNTCTKALREIEQRDVYVPSAKSGKDSATHEPRQGHIEGTDLPTLSFVINSFALEVEDGTASTGRLVWGNESKISIFEAMRRGAESPDAVAEAAEWLADYLALMDGRAGSAQIKAAGRTAGHSYDSLKRARVKIGSLVESSGVPWRTRWLHPKESREQPSEQHESKP